MKNLILALLAFSPLTVGLPAPPTVAILTPFSNIGEISSQKIGEKINSKAFNIVPPFPDSGRQHAVLEQESLLSKYDTGYSRLQKFVADFYNPKPIVDTIQPHEKFGNDGGKIRAASVAVVGAFEGLSNILNAVANVPSEAQKHINNKIYKAVAPVGALLAG